MLKTFFAPISSIFRFRDFFSHTITYIKKVLFSKFGGHPYTTYNFPYWKVSARIFFLNFFRARIFFSVSPARFLLLLPPPPITFLMVRPLTDKVRNDVSTIEWLANLAICVVYQDVRASRLKPRKNWCDAKWKSSWHVVTMLLKLVLNPSKCKLDNVSSIMNYPLHIIKVLSLLP